MSFALLIYLDFFNFCKCDVDSKQELGPGAETKTVFEEQMIIV